MSAMTMGPLDHHHHANKEGTSIDEAVISEMDNQVEIDATTIEQDNASKWEAMLEMFPLSKEELERCMACYPKLNETATFHSLVQATTSVVNLSNIHLERIRYVEATFLPESSRFLQQAYDDAFVLGTFHNDDEKEYKFLEAICSLVGRRGPRNLIRTIYSVAGQHEDSALRTPEELAGLVYRLVLGAHFLKTGRPHHMRPAPAAWIASLAQKCSQGHGVSMTEWVDWVNQVAPQVHQSLSTFAHYAFFGPDHPFMSSNPALHVPLTDQECSLWSDTFQTVPSSMALLSTQLGGKWIRQYSSDFDGFSFATFQQALLRYQGPTVLLIQTMAGDAFGFYTGGAWKDSRHWFGQDFDSFLFGLKPSLQYYGPTGSGKYSMYLHNPAIHRPGFLYGLCVGGVAEQSPRLHITTSFEQCKAQSIDGAFGTGPLLSNNELYFDIDVIEIWAVNVNDEDYASALAKGTAREQWKEGMRVHTAKVDRRQFLHDFQQGVFGSTLYEHRQQTRGRHSFVADDDETLGYFIEEKPPTLDLPSRRSLLEGSYSRRNVMEGSNRHNVMDGSSRRNLMDGSNN